jgi:hypothetical protein
MLPEALGLLVLSSGYCLALVVRAEKKKNRPVPTN